MDDGRGRPFDYQPGKASDLEAREWRYKHGSKRLGLFNDSIAVNEQSINGLELR